MLDSKSPEGIVHPVIEICYGDLDSPIVLIVELHMPVYPDWAHMMSALQQRFIVFLWSVNPYHAENFRVTPAYHTRSVKIIGNPLLECVKVIICFAVSDLLHTILFVLAATGTRGTRGNGFIIEGWQRYTTTWILSGQKLWVCAGNIPCHCIRYNKLNFEDCL